MNSHKMRKFAREYIENYPSIKKIYDSIAGSRRLGSEISVSTYIAAVKNFLKYLNFSDPETALTALKNGDLDAGAKVDGYIDYALADKPNGLGLSHSTTRSNVFGIKKWLDLNGVEVNWKKIELPTATEIREEDRAPTKEELIRILNNAGSERDRFVIFAATSSGLRIGTLLSLTIGDVDLSSYSDVARITVARKAGRKFSNRGRAAGRLFVTWITPEAKATLQAYFLERQTHGETLTAQSPLIGDYAYKGKFLSVEAWEKVYYRILKRVGLAQKSNRFYVLHVHTLRKYFRSNCIGVDASYREKWMGHRGLYLDMSYFHAEEQFHLLEYRKALKYLTVYPTKSEEKALRSQMLLDFARLNGCSDEEIKKLENVLARAETIEEGLEVFRKFKEDTYGAAEVKRGASVSCRGRHVVAHGEQEMIKLLEEGCRLVQPLQNESFLMERF
ncbi:MAG: site-specific integrase [Nitrososphaerota archaeon]|nr:site-specific integrase [Nitrososphaerota archaeon]